MLHSNLDKSKLVALFCSFLAYFCIIAEEHLISVVVVVDTAATFVVAVVCNECLRHCFNSIILTNMRFNRLCVDVMW